MWQMAKDYLAANIGEPLAFGLRAAGYLLVAGVLGLLAGANNWRRCIDAVAVLGFAAMSLAAGIDLVRAAGDTAQDCQNYLIAFVPVYSGIAAAGGQTAGALVYSGMFFAMAQFWQRSSANCFCRCWKFTSALRPVPASGAAARWRKPPPFSPSACIGC